MNRSAGTKVWLWVGVGCAVLLILGLVVVGVIVANFVRNPEVRSFVSEMSEMERAENLAPVLQDALEKYTTENGDFPPNLEALAPYLSEEEMRATTKAFTYSKPGPDAPDDQVILQSREFNLPGGGEMRIVIQKDLKSYGLTKSPLEPDFSGWNNRSKPSED
ncbi:MAG: hypothetical protein AB1725_11400 [Armatimonadota bacterium]